MTAVLVASCGGSDASTDTDAGSGEGTAAATFTQFNELTGQARTDALVKAAEEEGTVVFYTASSGMQPVIDAFEDTYDINVELFVGQSDTVAQRIVQEYQAGVYGVDVFDDTEAFGIANQGLAFDYVNPALTDPLPGFDPELQVVPSRLSVYTAAWNTNLVSDDEIPDTLEGFTDPKWEGRLSMDPTNWLWFTGVRNYYVNEEGWTDEQVDEMIRKIAANSVFHERASVQAQLLLAGEFAVSLSVYPQNILREYDKDPNAPITWRKEDGSYVTPLVLEPNGAILMKNAPHPAAAMLFLDFLVSEGQVVLSQSDHTPTALAVPNGPLEGIPTEDLHPVDMEAYTNNADEWAERFDSLTK